MRGCLFVLITAAVLVAAAAWFAAPPLAGTVVTAILQGNGYTATSSRVAVSADPPIELLVGRADVLAIDGDGVGWRTFHAQRMAITLHDVDLVARSAGSIEGTIDGAELRTAEGTPPTADVIIQGSGDHATAKIVVPAAAVDAVVRSELEAGSGLGVLSINLAEPDTIVVATSSGTIQGRLAVDAGGALVMPTPLGSLTIFAFDSSFPLRLTAVRAGPAGLELDGALDVRALLGG